MDSATPHSEGKPLRTAARLSLFTIGYNLIEGLVSIYFGIEENSVSLAGFGTDSFIEVFSATLVLWRLRGTLEREKQANTGIAYLFLGLAIVTAGASFIQLIEGRHPNTTLPGIIVAVASLSFMYFLWRKKVEVGTKLQSTTILNDASCALACIKLSVTLFIGSLLFYLDPSLWWVDAVAALVLSYFILREGWSIYKNRDSGGCGECC